MRGPGPTEALNNLITRVKRVAFGFRRFAHYRIRALVYAGKPNAMVTPRLRSEAPTKFDQLGRAR